VSLVRTTEMPNDDAWAGLSRTATMLRPKRLCCTARVTTTVNSNRAIDATYNPCVVR
jgi:hypothetical protein